MSVVFVSVGTRLFRNNEMCVLVRMISDTEWVLESIDTKRPTVLKLDDIYKEYLSGKIRFVGSDVAVQRVGGDEFNALRMDMLSDELRERAEYKFEFVKAIEKAGLNSLSPKTLNPLIEAVSRESESEYKKPHWHTVKRWFDKYTTSGEDVRSLVDNNKAKGNRKTRFEGKVIECAERAVADVYMTLERGTVEAALYRAIYLVEQENLLLAESERYDLPTRGLIQSVINKIDAYERAVARFGRYAANVRYRSSEHYVDASYPLERAEIDHTILDVMVIDDESMLPVGRPTLTVCMDTMTRCILGVYVGFEPPSYVAVAECLKHVFLPKTYLKEEFPDVLGEWSCFGVMSRLVVDQALEFHSAGIKSVCGSFGIGIEYCPGKTPWYKAKVERIVGTMNRAVAHGVPGTTFSNFFEKGDYDAAKSAVLTLNDLKWRIHKWVVDVYHNKIHKSLGRTPLDVWKENELGIKVKLPTSVDDIDFMMGVQKERVLTHKGVELNGLLYNSQGLNAIRLRCGERVNVVVIYRPANLGSVNVVDPVSGVRVNVPAVRADYAEGLSEWQHKVVKRYAKKVYERTEIEALARAVEELRAQTVILKKNGVLGNKRRKRFLTPVSGVSKIKVTGDEAFVVQDSVSARKDDHISVEKDGREARNSVSVQNGSAEPRLLDVERCDFDE